MLQRRHSGLVTEGTIRTNVFRIEIDGRSLEPANGDTDSKAIMSLHSHM